MCIDEHVATTSVCCDFVTHARAWRGTVCVVVVVVVVVCAPFMLKLVQATQRRTRLAQLIERWILSQWSCVRATRGILPHWPIAATRVIATADTHCTYNATRSCGIYRTTRALYDVPLFFVMDVSYRIAYDLPTSFMHSSSVSDDVHDHAQ